MKTIKELNAEYDTMCGEVLILENALSNLEVSSKVRIVLQDEIGNIKSRMALNTQMCDMVYKAQRAEVV